MINRLMLTRFRAFREAQFELSPLTIIAGQNSSGKSSIIQSINAILQSSQGRAFPLDMTLNGERAQLGGYRNVVHGHDARTSLGIGVEFDDEGGKVYLEGNFKVSEEEGHLFPTLVRAEGGSFGSLKLEWNKRSQKFNIYIEPSDELANRRRGEFLANVQRVFDQVDDARKEEIISLLKERVGSYSDQSSFSQAIKDLYVAAADRVFSEGEREVRKGVSYAEQSFAKLLQQASSVEFFDLIRRRMVESLARLRVRCSYIGPVRANPSRYFPLAGGDLTVDVSGEGMSRTLARWKDRRTALIGEVKSSLAKLELASDIAISVEHDEFLKVAIKPHGRTFSDSLADVGFGLSQVLPMIVADINLPKGGTLMVNQPEIHLHPSSQALLANYFCERLDKRQYIVETHSEYLINRVRLLVARGEIKKELVRIVYCGSDGKGGSRIFDVSVEEDGSLANAPSDFFSTYSADAFGIAMAVMNEGEDNGSK